MEVNMEYFDVVDKNRVQLNYKKIYKKCNSCDKFIYINYKDS